MYQVHNRNSEILARLKESGYRITPQRMAILDVVINDSTHPTVEQVYEKVKKDFPMTSRATVYKTIGLLRDMGVVMELNINGGSSHYDGYTPTAHPHLVCTQCNGIVDLEDPLFQGIPEKITKKYHYKFLSHRITLFGICPQCQE